MVHAGARTLPARALVRARARALPARALVRALPARALLCARALPARALVRARTACQGAGARARDMPARALVRARARAACQGDVDRGSKATLPLTIPRRVFKSSAKDSTRRSMGIALQGVSQGLSALRGSPMARASGGPRPPTAGRQTDDGRTRRF
ncbi:hypothetical protein VNO78_29698 [Psophocarpus tetragonolobus]|uniref:Uncharacterized protein n=1 Tax=Psophocarpus tetragonolobus TaxID=3891 RepID=A0AAN9RVA3_PSOTE